jgi:hypothetical protein
LGIWAFSIRPATPFHFDVRHERIRLGDIAIGAATAELIS